MCLYIRWGGTSQHYPGHVRVLIPTNSVNTTRRHPAPPDVPRLTANRLAMSTLPQEVAIGGHTTPPRPAGRDDAPDIPLPPPLLRHTGETTEVQCAGPRMLEIARDTLEDSLVGLNMPVFPEGRFDSGMSMSVPQEPAAVPGGALPGDAWFRLEEARRQMLCVMRACRQARDRRDDSLPQRPSAAIDARARLEQLLAEFDTRAARAQHQELSRLQQDVRVRGIDVTLHQLLDMGYAPLSMFDGVENMQT